MAKADARIAQKDNIHTNNNNNNRCDELTRCTGSGQVRMRARRAPLLVLWQPVRVHPLRK